MKKTLMIAALCLGFASAAAAEATYTLGTDTYDVKTGISSSPSDKYGNAPSFAFTLTNGLFTENSIAWVESDADSFTDKLVLTSLTLTNNQHQNYQTPGTLTITNTATGEVVATSDSWTLASDQVMYPNETSASNRLRDQYTWTFDNSQALTLLDVGTSYTVTVSGAKNINGIAVNWGVAALPVGSSDFAALTGSGQGGYMPAAMTMSLTSAVAAPVPEPATATLSLLALAGIAARRRRK